LNLLQPSGVSWKEDFNVLAFYGLGSIVLLIVSREINDRLILYSLDNDTEVVGRKNTAVAEVRGSAYMEAAVVVSGGVFKVDAGIVNALLWFVIGQAVLAVLDNIYSLGAPGMQKALASQDLACAFSLGGFLISGGLVLGSAISGESYGWTQDLIDVGYYLG